MWVRGLKHHYTYQQKHEVLSHPMWVRGLKLTSRFNEVPCGRSHPMWVRGLKLNGNTSVGNFNRRTLCGCVD